MSIIFVSHSIAQVQRICDRAIVLDKGEIIFSGNAHDASTEYFANIAKSDIAKLGNRAKGSVQNSTDPIQITNSRLLNDKGESIDEITMGDTVRLEFDYSSINEFNGVAIILDIFNVDMVRVTQIKIDSSESSIKINKNGVLA